MQEWFQNLFAATLGLGDLGITVGLVVSVIVKIVIILIPLILTVAYLTYFERKVIGFILNWRELDHARMVPKPLCRNARSGRFGYHRRFGGS